MFTSATSIGRGEHSVTRVCLQVVYSIIELLLACRLVGSVKAATPGINGDKHNVSIERGWIEVDGRADSIADRQDGPYHGC